MSIAYSMKEIKRSAENIANHIVEIYGSGLTNHQKREVELRLIRIVSEHVATSIFPECKREVDKEHERTIINFFEKHSDESWQKAMKHSQAVSAFQANNIEPIEVIVEPPAEQKSPLDYDF